MFRRKIPAPEPEVLPEWDETQFAALAQEIRKGGGPVDSWTAALRKADPEQVLSCLKKVPVVKDPVRALQRRLWIVLAAYRMQYERADQTEREKEGQMRELTEALGRMTLAQGQVDILHQRLQQVTGVAERAAMQVAKANARKKRTPCPRKIRAFVATATAANWDPERWDGNIWDSDDEDIDIYNPDKVAGPDRGSLMDPPPLTTSALPISRRREVQDPSGRRPRQSELLVEDFTQKEISDIRERMKQRPGEPLDKWLVRLYDQGAAQISIDHMDCHHFCDLSTDAVVRSQCREHRQPPIDGRSSDTTLLALMGTGVNQRYPDESSWPEKSGQWQTLSEAIARMRELTMRAGVYTRHVDVLDDLSLTVLTRNALIKTAPTPYKAAVMSVLLTVVGERIGDVAFRLRELGDLGEWDKSNHDGDYTWDPGVGWTI
ncbi:uncharacterized protein [Paramormyrops kingsleyae]|uniref:uncharacterized protein n=1 Tax=Paramormyrops kingsleyae TaxID=1676925 RepID=UPI003B96ECCE